MLLYVFVAMGEAKAMLCCIHKLHLTYIFTAKAMLLLFFVFTAILLFFTSIAFALLFFCLAPQYPQVVQQHRSDERNMITITDTTPHSNKARMAPGNWL
jgi:hypothetical protein